MSRRPPFRLSLALLLLLAARPASAWAPDEVLVKFRTSTPARDRVAIESAAGARVLTRFDRVGIERLGLPAGTPVADAVRALRADPRVEFAEPNFETRAAVTPNDPRFPEQWSLQNQGQTGGTSGDDIHAGSAWSRVTAAPNVLIGVLDTGVNLLHPDLAPNIWQNPGEIANGVDDDANGYVDDLHGYDF